MLQVRSRSYASDGRFELSLISTAADADGVGQVEDELAVVGDHWLDEFTFAWK